MRKICLFTLLVLTFGALSIPLSAATMFDFDGDGKADISVWRPSDGYWHIMKSSGGYSSIQWGQKDDALVPGDYDGDGKTDTAVYRSGNPFSANVTSDNIWYVLKSSDNTYLARALGKSTSISGLGYFAVPADYDSDGKTDVAVYAASDFFDNPTGYQILRSSDGSQEERRWGRSPDKRVHADYDGDGKLDLAVFRYIHVTNSTEAGIWQILQSSNGVVREVAFGLSTDKLVPADYDGDGKADIAVYRPSNGTWYIQQSRDGFRAMQFGVSTDKPTPADYDGDGKTDIAVFRPENGTWYLQRSKEGFAAHVFGFGDDIPVPNVYVR